MAEIRNCNIDKISILIIFILGFFLRIMYIDDYKKTKAFAKKIGAKLLFSKPCALNLKCRDPSLALRVGDNK